MENRRKGVSYILDNLEQDLSVSYKELQVLEAHKIYQLTSNKFLCFKYFFISFIAQS